MIQLIKINDKQKSYKKPVKKKTYIAYRRTSIKMETDFLLETMQVKRHQKKMYLKAER